LASSSSIASLRFLCTLEGAPQDEVLAKVKDLVTRPF
jgi:hypothetical protein